MPAPAQPSQPIPASAADGDGATAAPPPVRRRRQGGSDGTASTPITLALSDRVLEFFKGEGGDWQARINEALNVLVNRQQAREAKKRARLRARSAVKRRPPRETP